MKEKIFRLKGHVQHYAWGGFSFIPGLLGIKNDLQRPFAEYWMGAHPSAPSFLELDGEIKSWYELINENPAQQLGERVYQKFGELPYLFKILDVKEMLSIQVHPTKEEAEKGFDREDALGIPINASNRNYKDRNHKPEVMIALGDFWLLHGFKNEIDLIHVLKTIPEFSSLEELFKENGYYGLYKHIMEMPQDEVDGLLMPLVKRSLGSEHKKSEPGFWVAKLFSGQLPKGNIDRGIFSIYFFNIVGLQKGEGIFQAAGVPHAYLEGQNIELMANSDNVLRGGLTPKHIDVQELLKHIVFEGIEPNVLSAGSSNIIEHVFPIPIADFGISSISLESGNIYVNESESPEIFLVLQGEVQCSHLNSKRGEAFVVLPGANHTIKAVDNALMYKAFVQVDHK